MRAKEQFEFIVNWRYRCGIPRHICALSAKVKMPAGERSFTNFSSRAF